MRYFVIRGFGKKQDRQGREIDFDRVDHQLIEPALKAAGCTGGTTGHIVEPGNIRADMFELILEADVVVCDLTVHNANVFYELGVRHALRKKHTVLIRGEPTADAVPFDLSTDRYLAYDVADPAAAVARLTAAVKAGIDGLRETDSPIFLLLPTLAESHDHVCVVPLDFIEEVKRAEVAQDRGWLRLLAEDVRGQRYERDGLRAVARAQWACMDYEAAEENWRQVREQKPGDLEANLALANVYERLFRKTQQAQDLELSNQAIEQVLARPGLAPKDRAEARALQGRNLKTLWRLRLLPAGSTASDADKRALAYDRRLLDAYRAYRQAFDADLNAFFPGIAALQLATVLRELAQDAAAWDMLFDSEREAERARDDIGDEWLALRHTVEASIRRAVAQLEGRDLEWARISKADLLLLTEAESTLATKPERLIAAYRNAVGNASRFAWGSTLGQLELFDQVGVRSAAARAVIGALRQPEEPPCDCHVLVFAGHVMDGPDCPSARFPAAAEARARALIHERIEAQRRADEDLLVFASGAPGADILVHEVCADLGVPSVVCLPMPAAAVSDIAFGGHDGWRNRLLALAARNDKDKRLRVLQAHRDLPRWLRNRPPHQAIDTWERGNRWVFKMAQAHDATRRSLLVLWDGDETRGHAGGTTQMVKLARAAGFAIERIDSQVLIDG